jgi:ubiquinone/menaquinone biosynthesis C-methylase UbiE
MLSQFLQGQDSKKLIDIGCGDGVFLHAIKEKFPKIELSGLDLSSERLGRLKERDPDVTTYVGNACDLSQLYGRGFDLAVSSQVIEHVPNDETMIGEMNKIVRMDGSIYISSVVKMWYGWWIYKCNGKVTCDPTHVREYSSKREFEKVIESGGFKVLQTSATPFLPSFFNHLVRIALRKKIMTYKQFDSFARKHPRIFRFLKSSIRVWAPGYFIVESIAVKKSELS